MGVKYIAIVVLIGNYFIYQLLTEHGMDFAKEIFCPET